MFSNMGYKINIVFIIIGVLCDHNGIIQRIIFTFVILTCFLWWKSYASNRIEK